MNARTTAGSLGPRLAGRLTAELILRSPQYMNCVKLYEIDLRGNKICAIENLGATENQFDSIDLSDNAIVKLEGFPRLTRLKVLLLNSNRIVKISRGLEELIPSIEILVLTNNRIGNLQDLDPLATLSKLTTLSLLGNPVVTKPEYRLYVVSKLKHLKVLDFKKVKQKEREAAARMFPTETAVEEHGRATFIREASEEPVANGTAATAATEDGVAEAAPGEAPSASAPTPAQLTAIRAAIANAQTLEEVRRLEEALTKGSVPSEFQIEGGDKGGTSEPSSNGPTAMVEG